MKILLPVDGSRFSKRMLAYIAVHDEWLGAHHQYTVLTVVPYLRPTEALLASMESIRERYDEEASRVLAPARAFFDKRGLRAEFVERVGDAADAIVKLAGRGFDLVVMGSHGHRAIPGLALGSVTANVIARTKVPVLLVR